MSGNDTKLCPNCGQNIDTSKFFLHERMCSLNIKKCPKCNKPFTVDELEEHIEEVHGEAECEYCKKKFPKIEIENHKKKCDSKMVPCSYCELDILLSELKEHQKACGAITEPCEKCGRYIQRKEMERHLLEGCPPPKNDRRSVEVVHNSNNKYSLGNSNNNQNNYYNYFPINDFLFEDVLDENKGKLDIKSNNIKPNPLARPASTKKVPKNNTKKHVNKTGKNKINKEYNDVKDIINKKNSINTNNNDKNKHTSHHNNNNNKININENSTNIKVGGNKNSINEDKNKNNINDKGRILLKPATKSKMPINPNSNYFNTKNTTKHSTNTNRGNLKKNSKEKISEKEMRKTKEKEKEKKKKSNEVKIMPKLNNNNNNNKKGIITDEDYIANYNFEDIDEEQFLQQAIEQSIKEQAKK